MRLLRLAALLAAFSGCAAPAYAQQQPVAQSFTGFGPGQGWLRTMFTLNGKTQLDSVLIEIKKADVVIGFEVYTSTNPLKLLAKDTVYEGEARCTFVALKTPTGYLTGIHTTNISAAPLVLLVGVNQATDGTVCPVFPKDTTFDPRSPAAAQLTVRKTP